MSCSWIFKNGLFFVIYTFFIVELGLSYSKYSACSSPIHHWYMGYLCALFIHRIVYIIFERCNFVPRVKLILLVLLFPVTLCFFFIWNIVGTAFMVSISKSSDSSKCISKSSIVFNWILISVLYLLYAFLLFLIVVFYFKIRQMKYNKKYVSKKLREIYKNVSQMMLESDFEKSAAVVKDLKRLISTQKLILAKIKLLPQEQDLIKVFLNNHIENKPKFFGQLHYKRLGIEDLGRNELLYPETRDDLSESLLAWADSEGYQDSLNSPLSNTTLEQNPNEEPCIICLEDTSDEFAVVRLGCSHVFHDTCLFAWLNTNPKCPICKVSFRLKLLISISTYFERKKTIGNFKANVIRVE